MKGSGTKEVAALWDDYKNNRNPEIRERLILSYVPLVKHLVGRMAIGLTGYFEVDDLISAGVYGLINAVDRFDPDRGIKFETFAMARIRGAILDWLRSLNWIPQSVRAKGRKLENALVELEQQLGRPPEDRELADRLGLDLEGLNQLIQEVTPLTLLSLEECWYNPGSGGDGLSPTELIPDPKAEDPISHLELEETRQTLARAIEKLPEKERLVITLYYYEGLNLKEIGRVLGLSESRISQLHTKAILRLRGHLSRAKKSLLT